MKYPLLSAAAAAIVLFVAGEAAAAEPLATITVEAGKVDRLNTPVRAAVPEAAARWGPVRLERTDTYRPVSVPAQVEPGDPPHLAFVLPGTTSALVTVRGEGGST